MSVSASPLYTKRGIFCVLHFSYGEECDAVTSSNASPLNAHNATWQNSIHHNWQAQDGCNRILLQRSYIHPSFKCGTHFPLFFFCMQSSVQRVNILPDFRVEMSQPSCGGCSGQNTLHNWAGSFLQENLVGCLHAVLSSACRAIY